MKLYKCCHGNTGQAATKAKLCQQCPATALQFIEYRVKWERQQSSMLTASPKASRTPSIKLQGQSIASCIRGPRNRTWSTEVRGFDRSLQKISYLCVLSFLTNAISEIPDMFQKILSVVTIMAAVSVMTEVSPRLFFCISKCRSKSLALWEPYGSHNITIFTVKNEQWACSNKHFHF